MLRASLPDTRSGAASARTRCAQEVSKPTWLRRMQTNTPLPQNCVLRRDLAVLLEPAADAAQRAEKFAQFAVRARCWLAPPSRDATPDAPPRARARRRPSTTASAAWQRWRLHKTC
jgi:hypothetical protein